MSFTNLNKIKGSKFEKQVWSEILKIPFGATTTYKSIALNIGKGKSARAVANACGKNPMLEIIPCHRVLRSDGHLGGYSAAGGIKKKKQLLENEGHDFDINLRLIIR